MNQEKPNIQKIQDDMFKKMTAERKIQLVDQFFKLGKTLQALNDRKIYGSNKSSRKNSRHS